MSVIPIVIGSSTSTSITYGSNANGRWFKTFDQDGNVIKVEQWWIVTLVAGDTTIVLPTEMPDTNWVPSPGNNSTSRAVSAGFLSSTITTTGISCRAYNMASNLPVTSGTLSGIAIWSAA